MTNTMEDVSLRPTVTQTKDIAVLIRDAVKIYDKNNVVLRGLNMTVPKGKMLVFSVYYTNVYSSKSNH